MGAMAEDSGIEIDQLKVDGGAVVNDLLMQFQADLLGIPVTRPETIETTALGAAYLAGLAVGFWSGVEEISDQWSVDRIFRSSIGEEKRTSLRLHWEEAVSRASSPEPRGA